MARIVIVDDSTVIRYRLQQILERYDHEVSEAATGSEALQLYRRLKPDLVTMDINMPGKNGIETMKELIDEFPEAKVIMISSEDKGKNVVEALKSGAKNYILKPFNESKVIDTINEVLGV